MRQPDLDVLVPRRQIGEPHGRHGAVTGLGGAGGEVDHHGPPAARALPVGERAVDEQVVAAVGSRRHVAEGRGRAEAVDLDHGGGRPEHQPDPGGAGLGGEQLRVGQRAGTCGQAVRHDAHRRGLQLERAGQQVGGDRCADQGVQRCGPLVS
jgi:hypothetical protein